MSALLFVLVLGLTGEKGARKRANQAVSGLFPRKIARGSTGDCAQDASVARGIRLAGGLSVSLLGVGAVGVGRVGLLVVGALLGKLSCSRL